jgi:hypothetical protein
MLGMLYLVFRAVRFVLSFLHRICLGGFSISLKELVLAILIAFFLWNFVPILIGLLLALVAGIVSFIVLLFGGV